MAAHERVPKAVSRSGERPRATAKGAQEARGKTKAAGVAKGGLAKHGVAKDGVGMQGVGLHGVAKGEALLALRPGTSYERSSLIEMQRVAGNRATSALLALGQAKLAVGAVDDRYEREADSVAAAVVARLSAGKAAAEPAPAALAPASPGGALVAGPGPAIGEDDDLALAPLARMVSRKPDVGGGVIGPEGGDLDGDTESRLRAARAGGAPLPGGLRHSMEGAFGADFSAVKVHSGEAAGSLNQQVGATAFTVGADIFLGREAPSLASSAGQSLLAHELTHTVQQGGAHVHPEQD
ncbi:MAG TPA: DUF4157 domain-containing protein [Acidimicrobiales bacterium]|nr:DUF4157 domain-containing protein [Acidimicrobiales bacterium]